MNSHGNTLGWGDLGVEIITYRRGVPKKYMLLFWASPPTMPYIPPRALQNPTLTNINLPYPPRSSPFIPILHSECGGLALHDFTRLWPPRWAVYTRHWVAQIKKTMRLLEGSVGVANSMQYLVLLPGLAMAHGGEAFTQFRTHVTCKDGTRAERYPNDSKFLQFFSKNDPGDRLITQKAEQAVDVGSMLSWWSKVLCSGRINFEVSRLAAVRGQSMPNPIFFPKGLLVEEAAQAARRRTRQARAKIQVRPTARKQKSPRMRIQVDVLQNYA